MSMLIKGMEMPGSCIKCPIGFFVDEYTVLHCPLTEEEITESIFVHKRSEDCPLVPVPPHGRLIDADALIKELTLDDEDDNSGATLLMAIFLEVLKAAPTIIPAEEGEA